MSDLDDLEAGLDVFRQQAYRNSLYGSVGASNPNDPPSLVYADDELGQLNIELESEVLNAAHRLRSDLSELNTIISSSVD